jgi:hypothetical protein
MIVITPRPGQYLKTYDALQGVTPEIAAALARDGFEAGMRYTNAVTAADIEANLDAKIGLFFATEGLASSTVPTAQLGADMAGAAVRKLESLGIPLGATVFSDLEGAAHTPDAWIAYADAHADVIAAAHHIGGGYFGGGIGLLSDEMTALHCTRYGKGAARVKGRDNAFAEPGEGWSWIQGVPTDMKHSSGLSYDIGALFSDYRGRMVSLVVAS